MWVGMRKVFSHKAYTVTGVQMKEDFTLTDQYTTYNGKSGDWLVENHDGKKFILPDAYVQEQYVEVEKVEVKQTTKQLSPFEEQYYKNAYEEMAKLNNDESELYIKKKIDLVSNKAF